MTNIIKQAIQGSLAQFGYKLTRTATAGDPFAVQRQLIQAQSAVVFDVGAHVGAITDTYRRLFPQASIHAFEPFPEAFAALRDNVGGHPKTRCHQLALSDSVGTTAFNSNANWATNSLLATDTRGASFWGDGVLETRSTVEVKTTTVDAFCSEQRIGHVDILKLDVQGAEFNVLCGAKETLAQRQISLIYAEVILCATYQGQHELHEYLGFLKTYGYQFLDMFQPVRRHGQIIQADLVFVSPDLLGKLSSLWPNQ